MKNTTTQKELNLIKAQEIEAKFEAQEIEAFNKENKKQMDKIEKSKKSIIVEYNDIKFLVNEYNDEVINMNKNIVMTYAEFSKMLNKNTIVAKASKYKNVQKNIFNDAELYEMVDAVDEGGEFIYNTLEDTIITYTDNGANFYKKFIIGIDSKNINNSFIATIGYNKDTQAVNDNNEYGVQVGLSNTLLWYANEVDKAKEVLELLGFIDLGYNDYYNEVLKCNVDLNKEIIYFNDISIVKKEKSSKLKNGRVSRSTI